MGYSVSIWGCHIDTIGNKFPKAWIDAHIKDYSLTVNWVDVPRHASIFQQFNDGRQEGHSPLAY